MDLETVRWFLAVVEHGHVTNAASELGLSQPGLSRAVARLERELGVPLLDREGRSVRPSRYGEVFAAHARRLLAEEEAARRALAQAADPEGGEVALAFLHTQGTWLVPDLLRRFRRERPRVRFRLAQDTAAGLEEAVRGGAADLAITSPWPRDLAWAPMVTERLLLAVPADHRLAGRAALRLAEAAGEPFVAVRPGAGVRDTFEELARRAGFRPSILFEGDELSTIRGLVAAGLGVAVVPAGEGTGGGGSAGLAEIPLEDPGAERTIGLAWHGGRTLTPAADGFRRFVLDRTAGGRTAGRDGKVS
nr:LysR family transcriptional regulator [Actinomadura rugatobispora]